MFACYFQSIETRCRQHDQNIHDIYLGYDKFCDYSVAQVLYQHLAVSTLNRKNIFVCWDDKCGKENSVNWLAKSKVIILIISQESIQNIHQNAHVQQNSKLLEYLSC